MIIFCFCFTFLYFSIFRRLLLGAFGSINSSNFNVEVEDILFVDVCPTLESTFKYVFEQFNIEPERELNELTNIENDIVQYLAGFVSKKVGIMENCDKCSKALLTQNSKKSTCKFINFKSNGFCSTQMMMQSLFQ